MSNALIVALIAVGVALAAILIATARSGPRVTTTETRHDTDEPQGDL